ncbi:MAG: hypothetical protein ACJARY_000492 [Candidatus Azotimanducaceae bacterium]|jgi:hypothetical protein
MSVVPGGSTRSKCSATFSLRHQTFLWIEENNPMKVITHDGECVNGDSEALS